MESERAAARLRNELKAILNDSPPYIHVAPNENNFLQWNYLLQGLEGTPYEGGWYWGRLFYNDNCPYKLPAIIMLTPNGHFGCNKYFCLSTSRFHPEFWRPELTLAKVLQGLLSVMCEETYALGTIVPLPSPEERSRLAAASSEWNRGNTEFQIAFPDFDVMTVNQRRAREVGERIPDDLPADTDVNAEDSPSVLLSIMEETDDYAPICRICYDGDAAEGDVLIAPCLCNGTLKYVHRICLDAWRLRGSDPTSRTHCGTCGGPFNFHEADVVGGDDLPEHRKIVLDVERGRRYYWHEITHTVQWEKPVRTPAEGGGDQDDWHSTWDPAQGREYYWNARTGENQWERPRDMLNNDGGHLPEHWKAVWDPRRGRRYYWHVMTDEVQWERPARVERAAQPAPPQEPAGPQGQ